MPEVRIGTAGWSLPRQLAHEFPNEGTALERYSGRLNCAEVNSSFHRPHRASTWQRWRDSVPDDFRFSAKLPKTITHQLRLKDVEEPLEAFLQEVAHLGEKLSVLLVQLPPSLQFEEATVANFFAQLQGQTSVRIACEPRHESWFAEEADDALTRLQVARVAADPARVPDAAQPGGWPGLRYWRLHGSPIMYRSSYAGRLPSYAAEITSHDDQDCWCIFDNTASSAATGDALALRDLNRR